jgi:hypothetical protein
MQNHKQFILWYLFIDYLPRLDRENISTYLNRLLLLFLFIFGFISTGIIEAYRESNKNELNDPFINALPINFYNNLTNSRLPDTAIFNPNTYNSYFPNLQIFPYERGFCDVLMNNRSDTIRLYGIKLSGDHPFLNILFNGEFLWKNTNENLVSNLEGIIVRDETLKKMGYTTKESQQNYTEINSVRIIELFYDSINKEIPICAIFDRLPDLGTQIDFIITDEYFQKITFSQLEHEKISSKEWKIYFYSQSANGSFFNINNIKIQIAKNENVHRIKTGMKGDSSFIQIKFKNTEFTKKQIIGMLDSLKINNACYFETVGGLKKSNIDTKKFSKIKWLFGTISIPSEIKHDLNSLIEKIELTYPGVVIEDRSIRLVQKLKQISESLDIIYYIFLAFIIIMGGIINYKILQYSIHKKKNQIGFIQTIGVPKSIFLIIYFCEALIDTISFSVIGFLFALVLNLVFKENVYHFSYLDRDIFIFSASMMTIMVITYLWIINQKLSIPFRQLLKSA